MQLNIRCITCQINRYEKRLQQLENEQIKMKHYNHILKLIIESDPLDTLAYLNMKIEAYLAPYLPQLIDYSSLKVKYNDMMLKMSQQFETWINTQNDPIYACLQLARAANYIDFGAMEQISENKLLNLLQQAFDDPLDLCVYQQFIKELQTANHIIYCLDNCGEIVLDKIAIQTLKKHYPHVRIQAMVRGGNVLNDVTIEDAKAIGLDQVCEIITNDYPMAGIDIHHILPYTKQNLKAADFIISKGQGNFESLCGCGLNIYYLLLCKCDLFAKRFEMPLYKGVFQNERMLGK